MKAQEMFEELGYEKQQEKDRRIRYVKSFETCACFIEFSIYGTFTSYLDDDTPLPINTEELKAIVQQCKELGCFSESIPITTYERLRGEIKELKQENEELKEELQLSKENRIHLFVDDDMLIEQNKRLKEEINMLMKKIEEQDYEIERLEKKAEGVDSYK